MPYAFRRAITIDHTKCGASNSTDFPILFSTNCDTLNGAINNSVTSITVTSGIQIQNNDYIRMDSEIMQVTSGGGTTSLVVTRGQLSTSAASHVTGLAITNCFLASAANGGSVTNASGYDIIFTSDIFGTTPLTWEIDTYSTTGIAQFWVKIPTLSHSVDTTIYVFYGNAAITTFQSVAANVWSNNFVSVWHAGSLSSLSVSDSVGPNGGVNHSDTAATGVFPLNYKASIATETMAGGSFFSSGSGYVDVGSDSSMNLSTLTLEAWALPVNTGSPFMVFSKLDAGANKGYEMYVGQGNLSFQFADGTHLALYRVSSGISILQAFHAAVTLTGNTGLMYANGASVSFSNIGAAATGILASTVNANIGARQGTVNMNGNIDELRLSSVVRSADWILSSYNSCSSPYTFYSLGGPNVAPYVVYPYAVVLKGATIGTAYSETISTAGGTGPFTYAVTSGSLPPGLSLTGSTGVIAGTPTTVGTYTFTITSTDSLAGTGGTGFSITASIVSSGGGSFLFIN